MPSCARSFFAGGLFALTVSLALAAETLTLTDGRTLQDATVISQSPRRVVVRHAGGLASVEKTKLPAPLRERYPVDEAAAKAEDEKAAADLERQRAEDAERAKQWTEAERTARKAKPEPTAEEKARAERAQALAVAAPLAKSYFETQYNKPIGGTISSTVTLDDARKMDGWGDRWVVTGQAVLRYYRDLPPDRKERDPGSSEYRDATAKRLRRLDEREAYLRTEVVRFEADVIDAATTPTIQVSIR